VRQDVQDKEGGGGLDPAAPWCILLRLVWPWTQGLLGWPRPCCAQMASAFGSKRSPPFPPARSHALAACQIAHGVCWCGKVRADKSFLPFRNQYIMLNTSTFLLLSTRKWQEEEDTIPTEYDIGRKRQPNSRTVLRLEPLHHIGLNMNGGSLYCTVSFNAQAFFSHDKMRGPCLN
jgi:hypothetical protein